LTGSAIAGGGPLARQQMRMSSGPTDQISRRHAAHAKVGFRVMGCLSSPTRGRSALRPGTPVGVQGVRNDFQYRWSRALWGRHLGRLQVSSRRAMKSTQSSKSCPDLNLHLTLSCPCDSSGIGRPSSARSRLKVGRGSRPAYRGAPRAGPRSAVEKRSKCGGMSGLERIPVVLRPGSEGQNLAMSGSQRSSSSSALASFRSGVWKPSVNHP
jgi:hypothetical protein